jgi:drug/metabolite transporter (DMT)-like permease
MSNKVFPIKSDTKGTLILLIISIYWGLTSILMKNSLQYMTSVTYLFLRFLSASIFLLIIFYKKLKRIKKETVIKSLIISLLLAGNMELLVLGLNYTSNSNSVFISNMTVVVVPMILCIKNKNLPPLNLIICIIIIIVGLLFLSGGTGFHLNIGDGITFGSTIITSFGILKTEKYSKTEEPILLGMLQIFFACIISFIVWAAFGFESFIINRDSVMIIFLTGVIGTGIAFICQVIGQKLTSSIKTALAFISISIFGVIGSALIPNAQGTVEAMNMNKIIGSIIIVAGMVIYTITNDRRKNLKI